MNLEIAKFQLLNKLKDNSAKRRKLATSGKLEPSRLAHYKTSKLLYSEPIPWTGKEYVCEILLDMSKSMAHWYRAKPAVESLKGIMELFNWVIDFRVTVFARSSYTVSRNRILSIPSTFDSHRIVNWFNTKTWVFSGDCQPTEWGHDDFYMGTWGCWTLEKARRDFTGDKRDKIIVLITDGDDESYEWNDYKDEDKERKTTTSVCWIPLSEANPEKWKEVVSQVKDDWILFIPIGIDKSLPHIDENYINLEDASKIYEEVINFISTNIQ